MSNILIGLCFCFLLTSNLLVNPVSRYTVSRVANLYFHQCNGRTVRMMTMTPEALSKIISFNQTMPTLAMEIERSSMCCYIAFITSRGLLNQSMRDNETFHLQSRCISNSLSLIALVERTKSFILS